jgi:hypothetical protein
MELYKQLRLKTGAVAEGPVAPGELENHIGPFALDGERLWFANESYDGAGPSGVEAIGSIGITTLQYEMRYLPEIAPWSGSALLVDQDLVWVGRMRLKAWPTAAACSNTISKQGWFAPIPSRITYRP